MKIFITEYFTSGQCPGITAENSLFREGWGMLAAFLEDAAKRTPPGAPAIQCLTLLGAEPLTPLPPDVEVYYAAQPEQAHEQFLALASSCDWTLVIAPETEGILLQQYDRVLAVGSRWLGCDRNAIEICSDKLAMAQLWDSLNLPTPSTQLLTEMPNLDSAHSIEFPIVLKPRDGAGGDQTWKIEHATEFQRFLQYATPEERQLYLVQPFVSGQPCSLGVLSLEDEDHLFPIGQQNIRWENGFHYGGGEMPVQLPTEVSSLLKDYVGQIRQALPGLAGYWGLDFIWDTENRDSPLSLIEINPRLTTSYLGYRQLTALNLAQYWIQDCHGIESETKQIDWQSELVSFSTER
ncbi:carbamoyl phosphate synthase-like protein [Polystyrenella longa]|uniref:Carbamoyl phosphate synthase-like protein n=1 Tax=Polystyrenella longa TaxID=2528007 RepID=A0A518CIJ6_9PLAN|nr:ATP-grasp domain-containing protein [Polystyrenella longa]QDU79049.1 carbamoyl phosphate synthase-like protein [Polystyrenella longa]